jgi:hypothetical protein
MRALTVRGGGHYSHVYLSGRGGLCEVCADHDRYQAILDAYVILPPERRTALRNQASRARMHLGRILRDGRAYSPDSPDHGNYYTYSRRGCRCAPCRAYKAADNAARRNQPTLDGARHT